MHSYNLSKMKSVIKNMFNVLNIENNLIMSIKYTLYPQLYKLLYTYRYIKTDSNLKLST